MFLEELAALKNRYLDRLQVFHFLEDEAEEIELFNGRLDVDKCRRRCWTPWSTSSGWTPSSSAGPSR